MEKVSKEQIEKKLEIFFKENTLPKKLESDDDAVEELNRRWVYSVAEELDVDEKKVLKIYNKLYDSNLELE